MARPPNLENCLIEKKKGNCVILQLGNRALSLASGLSAFPPVRLWKHESCTLQKSASSVEVKGEGCFQVLGCDEIGNVGWAFKVKGISQNAHVACSL